MSSGGIFSAGGSHSSGPTGKTSCYIHKEIHKTPFSLLMLFCKKQWCCLLCYCVNILCNLSIFALILNVTTLQKFPQDFMQALCLKSETDALKKYIKKVFYFCWELILSAPSFLSSSGTWLFWPICRKISNTYCKYTINIICTHTHRDLQEMAQELWEKYVPVELYIRCFCNTEKKT